MVIDPYAAGLQHASGSILQGANSSAGSPEYAAFVTPANGVVVQYRSTAAGTTTRIAQLKASTVPVFLEVSRSGTSFRAYTSSNGISWTLIAGSTVNIGGMTGALLEGLAVTSHNAATLCTVTMDGVHAS